MSEPEHDPEIAQRFRELEREEPPRTLDARILAAARRELEVLPAPLVAPSARRRWYVPLAAAAVIMLSVAVTLHLQREQPDPELAPPGYPPPIQEPAPVAPTPAAPPKADRARDAAKEPAVAPKRAQEEHSPAAPRAAPAPSDASPAATVSVPEAPPGAETERVRRSDVESAAKPADVDSSPEAWLARIVELRREGRLAQADESYAAFRRRYPEYRIPDAIRDQVLPR